MVLMPVVCQASPIGVNFSRLPSQVNFAASNRAAAFSCGEPMSGAKAALEAGIPNARPSGGAVDQREFISVSEPPPGKCLTVKVGSPRMWPGGGGAREGAQAAEAPPRAGTPTKGNGLRP